MLYEVDLALRPSGRDGPLLPARFLCRRSGPARLTWEHMALTRARGLFVAAGISPKIEKIIREVADAAAPNAVSVAHRLRRHARAVRWRRARHIWDLKYAAARRMSISTSSRNTCPLVQPPTDRPSPTSQRFQVARPQPRLGRGCAQSSAEFLRPAAHSIMI